jgi:ribosomal 30S subunit maturation factor RimM
MRVRFAEEGIAEERKLHREVIIAIPPDDQEEDDTPVDVLGFSVVFQDKEIGVVEDYFHNNAQYVLVIKCGAHELLIPWVDYYVSDIIPDPGVIVLNNVESFLEDMANSDAD